MIKETELRIGNLVNRKYYNPQPNNESWELEPVEIAAIGFNRFNVKMKNGGHSVIDYIEPIKISDIWPEKLGFKQVKFDYVIPISPCGVCTLTLIPQDELCNIFSVMVSQSDDTDPDENVFLEDVSFVHELQNLYFGITKKELIKTHIK